MYVHVIAHRVYALRYYDLRVCLCALEPVPLLLPLSALAEEGPASAAWVLPQFSSED